MDVDYCENSTIVEAWGLIVGLPAPLVGDPAAVITHFGKHQFPDLEPRPAVVAVGGSAKEVIPHWTQQWSWDQGQYLARYGHRYLSVHFLRKGESNGANPRYHESETKCWKLGIQPNGWPPSASLDGWSVLEVTRDY